MQFDWDAFESPIDSNQDNYDMPSELRDMFKELIRWADRNHEESKHDAIKFWMLKIPAIVFSACSGVLSFFHEYIAVVTGAVASICILIDGLNPQGLLRNVHHQAWHDIQTLVSQTYDKWRVGSLKGEDHNQLAATIIENKLKGSVTTDNHSHQPIPQSNK